MSSGLYLSIKRSLPCFYNPNEAHLLRSLAHYRRPWGHAVSSCGRTFQPTKPQILLAREPDVTVFAPQEGSTMAKRISALAREPSRMGSQREDGA